jgi:hypothetical protein
VEPPDNPAGNATNPEHPPTLREELAAGLRALGYDEPTIERLLVTPCLRAAIEREAEHQAAGGAVLDALGPARFVSLLEIATKLLGGIDVALSWLTLPNRYLGAQIPLEAAISPEGFAAVRQSLFTIAYGGVA